ncbi:MAG: hypothetical protein QOC99_1655 [Acidobacteriota bacterium]|nr:hypothetical protein [Acidobacteriota bacterium]
MTSALAEPDSLRRRTHAGRGRLAALRTRAEFGDALLFFYLLVFVRQYLWVFDSNALAWGLSAPLAAAAWYFYVRTKPLATAGTGREFWLVVLPPLVFFYLLRLPFPDVSFDVLNYRLLHAERSLRGTLFAPGDFFPTAAPYNPAPDTLTGLFRLALGYRLGTIVNLLALVWAAQVIDKILRPFVSRAWPRAACVLVVVLAEQLLFEVNNYMVDLLALPLLLEATWLALGAEDALRAEDDESLRAVFVRIALLVGASAALKLTNAAVILPIITVCAYKALAGKRRLKLTELPATVALSFVAFVAPLVPFGVYLWRLTGNPFFPLANGFFKSPYWPTGGGWDERWGPKGFWETVAWPVLASFEPTRHSELSVYSGRITLGFVVALCGLLLAWRDARLRPLCLVLLAGCLLWSAGGMGYSRYGLYLELLSGAVVVAVASSLLKATRNDSSKRNDSSTRNASSSSAAVSTPRAAVSWRTAVAALFSVALCVQAAWACRYALGYEWSMRPTALSSWSAYRHEARFIFRDRALRSFLSEEARTLFDGPHAWVESGVKSTGVEVLIDAQAPVITVNRQEYFATRTARETFVRTIKAAPARMLSLCLPEDLLQAKEFITSRGLSVGRVVPVQVPFFSQRNRIGMMLIEVTRPEGSEGEAALERFWKTSALPDEDYRAGITTAADAPTTMRAGERVGLRLRVRNLGRSTWPAHGDTRGMYQVNIGDRWLDETGTRVVNDLDGRMSLPEDLRPGVEVELPLNVTAPRSPGEYVLEIDLIHESVTFFGEKGSRTLRLHVRVEP